MDPIKEYVVTVLKKAGLDTLPDELRLGLEEQLMILAYRKIGEVVMQQLNEEKQKQFVDLIEADPENINHDAINQFLSEHTNKLDVQVKDALGELGANFLSRMENQSV